MAMAFPISEAISGRNSTRHALVISDFFKTLPIEAMNDFQSCASYRSCPSGMVLFVEGQPSESVFVLLRGQVKLSMNSTDGRRFIFRIAQPIELLGMAPAFSGNFHEMTAEAVAPCQIASIHSQDFVDFVRRYPEASLSVARQLSACHHQTCVRLRMMGIMSAVSAKLAILLLEWSVTGRETERGILVDIALTHTEIGECIGTSRETITRIFSDFHRRRIVDLHGTLLTVIDRPALEICAHI